MSQRGASLTVRNLSPETKTRLAVRARRRGRSLEAEVRAILDSAAEAQEEQDLDFPHWLMAMLEPGDDDIAPFLDEHRKPHPPLKL